MMTVKKCQAYNFIILFIICYQSINCENVNYGMKFVKAFQLNNGNIMIAGDIGINTYDNTGLNLLYNCTLIEKLNTEESAKYRAFAQFSEDYNSIVIAIVMNVIYIFDDNGNNIFIDRLNISFSFFGDKFYTIVPHIYKDGKYYFILGFAKEKKPYLQYISFDLTNKNFTLEDDDELTDYECNDGLTCQMMNYQNNDVFTCFYLNTYPPGIYAYSLEIIDNKIEYLYLNTSYYDKTFVIQSVMSEDRKKSLLCYIRNEESSNFRYGFCDIYDIESNRFLNYSKYSTSRLYGTSLNNINLNYFKETKEYIFSFSGYNEGVTVMIFNENLEIIKMKCGNETLDYCIIPLSTNCQNIPTFSIVTISNEYKIIGHHSCNGEETSFIDPLFGENNTSNTDTILSTMINSNLKGSTIISTLFNNIQTSIFKSTWLNSRTTQPYLGTSAINSKTTIPINPSPRSSLISKTSLITINLNVDSIDSSLLKTTICNGYRDNEGTICSDNIPIGYYLKDNINNIIEKCYFSCESCEKKPEEDIILCLSCKENFELDQDNNCLYKYNFYYNKEIKENIYLSKNQLCPEYYPFEIVETKECVESCEIMEFINKLCFINNFSQNNLNNITEKMKKIINEVDDINYDVIIDGNNIIYEITTSSVKTDHQNISFIDFGECEKILKSHYIIDYLLVFKIDIKLNESCPLDVEYEVYSPETKQKLNMSLCESKNIDIYIPISMDNQTNYLVNSMNQNGIDILNGNNSFYNDICMPFTTEEGTDISLTDRQNTYYNEKITLCENNCEYMGYNSTNRKAKCQCKIKKEISNIKIISYDTISVHQFLDIKTITNIEIMKCYKLTFSKDGLSNNYGFIILSAFIVFFISLIIIYLLTEKTAVPRIIRFALKNFTIDAPPRKKSSKKNLSQLGTKLRSEKIINSSLKQSQTIRDLIDTNNIVINKPRKKNSEKMQINNYHSINVIKEANIILDCDKSLKIFHKKHKKKKRKKKKKSHLKDNNINQTINNCENTTKNKIQLMECNEQEINSLPYKEAIKLDKRTYCQYYWSLIRNKHIILFIFMPSYDYNLISIKLGLFIFSFCLNFTVNAFFFTDETMHKIYEDKGIFNFLFQLPSMIYSCLISSVINLFIRTLALSDKIIFQFKRIYNKKIPKEKTVELYKSLTLKFNIFFCVSFVFLLFFWYYISTFCAVYKNTQIILISSTLSSFSISLIYPFGLNLLPGLFRIPALKPSQNNKEKHKHKHKTKEKSNECLYDTGNIVALV